MAVLAKGGNAFDAAVATGFVLQVVEPHLCGPGGEVPAVFVTATDTTPRVLCGQGTAPAAATIAHMRGQLGLEIIPGTGLLPATVPGAWGAWLSLLRDYGTWTLREALTPAIDYAGAGFPLVPQACATIATVSGMFEAHWPTSAATWLDSPRNNTAWRRHTLPVLAATWDRLVRVAEQRGADRERQIDAAIEAWYCGFVAETIDVFCRTAVRDATGRYHAGLLAGEDLARWTPTYEDAVAVSLLDGWTIAKPSAWSQGPVLPQALKIIGAGTEFDDGVASEKTVHRCVEAMKLSLADREAWLGDSAPVPLRSLLSDDYCHNRARLIDAISSPVLRPGHPDGRQPSLPGAIALAGTRRTELGAGEPTVAPTGVTRGDTVHVDVVDAAGNMISATPSGGWLQSSPTIPSLGFCLGTRAQMFWLIEGLPSSLEPGRRPRTTLSPSLALRNGEPNLAFGTPGGDQQDQWQLCFFLAHAVGGLDLQAAIDAPTWHTTAAPSSFAPREWEPNGLVLESRFTSTTIDALRRRGHAVTVAGPWELGRMCAVGRSHGEVRAAVHTRTGVAAAGAM
jgi:gamma-glutamyltranspeptidase/glutathione hydrolase